MKTNCSEPEGKQQGRKYIEIQKAAIEKYNIRINPYSQCRARTHAHIRKRTVCKWDYKNSAAATFTLFHEIGHIENNNSRMRRYEQEFYATEWAIERCREYGVVIPEKIRREYEDYIQRELDRGLRRGGTGYDRELKLHW